MRKGVWYGLLTGLALLLAAYGGGDQSQPDLTLAGISPQNPAVVQGQTLTLTLTFTSQNGFQGPVSLRVLEGGQPVSWLSPNSVQRNLNVPRGQQVQETLQVQVAPNAPTGSRNLTVRAAYGNRVTERALTLTVNAPPDFTISLNPTSLRVQQGGSGTTRLTITPQNGFTGTVSLSLAAGRDPVPQGLSLSPQSVQVSGANPVNQTLTVSASSSTPTGTHRLKVRGTSGSLVKEVDLTLTVTAPLRATLDWTPLFLLALGYLLLFLFARTYLIACPSRALARAQLEGLWAEHVEGREEGQKQEEDQRKRDAREDVRQCLEEAKKLLQGSLDKAEKLPQGSSDEDKKHQGCDLARLWGWICSRLSLLFWNGEREMAAWALMHRAERRAAALMGDEEVRARLVRGLGELGAFPEEEKALWQKQLKCALGREGQGQKEQGSLSGSREWGPTEQRALLEEFLAALYNARDTRYARLLTLHNKAAWLLPVGLGLWVALGFFAPGLPNGLSLGTGLLLGFLGGVLSRLLRVVAAKELPTDYGAYWVPLFLAPVLGALGAVGGYLVFWALVEVRALGEGLKPLLSPPAAYGLFVALGFSERLLKGLTERLEDQALKQEDQGKEKPKGDGKEGQGKPQDQQPKQ